MSKMEFLGHMNEILELPSGTLAGAEKLDELDVWNSLAMMSFIAFADEHFRLSLSPRQFMSAHTINDLGKLVGVTA